MTSFQRSKIGDLYTKLRGVDITAKRMKEIADDNGNVRIFSGGATIVDAKEADLANVCIHRVPAVVVQAFGVVNVQYVETPFTFRSSFWAYTHERKELVEWLYYWLEKRIELLRQRGSAHMIPKIKASDVDSIEIEIPDDVKERAATLRKLSYAIGGDGNIAERIKQVSKAYEATREGIFAKLKRRRNDNRSDLRPD